VNAQPEEWSRLSHHSRCDVSLLHAYYVRHAYPRHSHDYYVISLIGRGHQSFMHRGTQHRTPPGGLILINPEAAHTGEPADRHGFELRSLYPTVEHMQAAAYELTGRRRGLPFFREVRVDDARLAHEFARLHRALSGEADGLECESRLLWTLARLIGRQADVRFEQERLGRESSAAQRARIYIEEHFADPIRLSELAAHVALSPYYFLRAFRTEVGMPPYTYLESVRVREAQRRIRAGMPLAEAALETGFNSQAHMTRRFKKVIGVTPGQYARD
jgi:AraC-like DNA-binding protein